MASRASRTTGGAGSSTPLSDDQSVLNPARFYTLRVDLSGRPPRQRRRPISSPSTTLLAPDGQPYAPASLDPEGLTLAKSGELLVTSEGIATRGIAAWVRRYALDGTFLGDLPVLVVRPDQRRTRRAPEPRLRSGRGRPERSASLRRHGERPGAGRPRGVDRRRESRRGSSATTSRPAASNAPVRLRPLTLIAEPPVPATNFAVNGLVELLPLNDRVHALDGALLLGRRARHREHDQALLRWRSPGADDVNGVESLAGTLGNVQAGSGRRSCSTCARSGSRSTTSRG